MFWFWMLVSYGLCFGLANKATFLHHKFKILDKLLSCAYCTGFHTGWMTWLLAAATGQHEISGNPATCAIGIISWAFASSAFCYTIDTVLQRLEKS